MLLQKLFIISLLLPFALMANYTLEPSSRPHSAIDTMPKSKVADMRNIPQDPAYYASQIEPLSPKKQQQLDSEFNQKYFKPWSLTHLDIPKSDLGWEVRFITRKPIYHNNGKEIYPSVYNRWIANAQYKQIDTKGYHAITIRRTNVKALPTKTPFYRDPKKTGEGFPFDYNQNSALHMNVPLYISHFSKDHRWAFVQASYAFGWVKVSDLALVDKAFIHAFKNGNYAMVTQDNLRLYNEKHQSVSLVKIGTLFPLAKKKGTYLCATRQDNAMAALKRLTPKKPTLLAKKPLAFNKENVAKLAREFYGEPYGWGGGYGCRDCSATTRDFLGAFGIFLQRNSSKQAKDGTQITIKNWPKWYKKKFINENAKPFRSLLYVPGHIVLYLGEYKGEPVIMHTYWGIRKKDGSKLITGRTIISSTEPGKERKDVKERAKLINTLRTIVNFD